MKLPRKLNLGMARFSGLYLWALIIITFGIWTPHLFLTSATVHSIASAQSIVAMLAIAALISMSAGAFDVSIGAVANLSTITVVSLQSMYHWAMWPSVGVAIAMSALVGVINGFLIVKLKISSIVATLGMGSVLLAIQTIVSKAGQPFPPLNPHWSPLTQRTIFGFQIVVFYLIILAVLVWWVMEHTPAGRYVYAVGGNVDAARLSGVKVNRWTWLSLVTSSTICGFAGVAYGSLAGPSLTYGGTMLLPAFAAVFLGSTQIKPGRFNLWGTMIAVFVLATGVQGLQLVTGVQWLNDMFSGLALILAVAFAGWRQRRVISSRRLGRRLPEGQRPSSEDIEDPDAQVLART
jgi:ribose transport system permease protein